MFNIVSFGKKFENLEKAVKFETIGSNLSTFGDSIKEGSLIFLHCRGKIWGTAVAEGPCFESFERLWEDKIYPKRFKISKIFLIEKPIELSDGVINSKLRTDYGIGWAYKFIFSPKPLPKEIAQLILTKMNKQRPGFELI